MLISPRKCGAVRFTRSARQGAKPPWRVLKTFPAATLVCPQEQNNVATVVKKFNLSQKFVDMSYGIFQQLDLDKNGAIDQK